MDASFIELAQAVRDTHTIGLQTLARLAGVMPDDELEEMRGRKARLLETAELLTLAAPHEVLVRSILRVGGFADFPEEYTADLRTLNVGSTGLFRGAVLDIMPVECQVEFQAQRIRTKVWVSRGNLVGVARARRTMWTAPPAR
jgi:hypothetical protein